MAWTALNFAPGVDKDNSPLEAGKRGRFDDADKVRFVDGLPETIYGWERATSSALLGICRGAFTWQDNSQNSLAAFGTHLRLYAMDVDGNVTDITPATSYAQSSISFTTVSGSTTVTITGWTHGLSVDQKCKFENATVSTVGGVTINGTFTVLTVESTTSITYTAASAASSSAGPTASQVDITIYLAPGQLDGLGGLGFGVGGFGVGGFGSSSSGYSLFPRTYSLAQWGQNLIANPRQAGIYEWAPNVTATELITNGNFSSSVGWTPGAGWTIGAGAANASVGASSSLTQSVSLSTGAYHLLTLSTTVGAGSFLPTHANLTIGSGSISATGLYRLPFFSNGGTETLSFTKDATFSGVIKNVSLQVLTTARIVPNAPTQVGSMFVTDQRQLVACGSNLDGSFDPLQIDWTDFENNQSWTPSSSNFAGGYTIPRGGRIVRGLPGSGENVIWTRTAIWSMHYNGDPNSVFDFVEKGSGCGLIGPNAAVEINGVWYWITPEGAVMAYGGSAPVMLPCSLSRDFKDNLANVQQDKIYAAKVIGKTHAEAWWFYPDIRDGNECSRYIMVDTRNPSIWSCGAWDRTAWTDAPNFEFPLAVDTSGNIWFQEKGFSEDGGARSWFVESAFAKAEGQMILNGIKPDSDDQQGGYTITPSIRNRDVRGVFSRTYPAMNITTATGKASCRVKGEQIRVRFAGNDSPTFWRLGATEIDLELRGAKR